jgi:5-methyltetrahydropteroyltriglutamate--homocysteine methyltransferase
MANRILTAHVGSLPRPAKFIEVSQKRTLGEKFDEAGYEAELKNAVADVVKRQKEAGVDLINDGELAHTMGWAYDYGSWWSYVDGCHAGKSLLAKRISERPACDL